MSLTHAIVSPEQLDGTAEAAPTAGLLSGLRPPWWLWDLVCCNDYCVSQLIARHQIARLGAAMLLKQEAGCCWPMSCHTSGNWYKVLPPAACGVGCPALLGGCDLCWTPMLQSHLAHCSSSMAADNLPAVAVCSAVNGLGLTGTISYSISSCTSMTTL